MTTRIKHRQDPSINGIHKIFSFWTSIPLSTLVRICHNPSIRNSWRLTHRIFLPGRLFLTPPWQFFGDTFCLEGAFRVWREGIFRKSVPLKMPVKQLLTPSRKVDFIGEPLAINYLIHCHCHDRMPRCFHYRMCWPNFQYSVSVLSIWERKTEKWVKVEKESESHAGQQVNHSQNTTAYYEDDAILKVRVSRAVR